jgi:hypothetical protein
MLFVILLWRLLHLFPLGQLFLVSSYQLQIVFI